MLAAMCSGRTGMYDKLTALNFIKFAARAYAFSVFLLNKHAQAHNIIFVQVKKKASYLVWQRDLYRDRCARS